MAIVLIRNDQKTATWLNAFKNLDSNLEVYDFHKPHPEKEIKMAAVWKHPKHSLETYPNLQAVHSMGAGVDFILEDKSLNPKLQILRVKDLNLASDMAEYILAQILMVLKDLRKYQEFQAEQLWNPQVYRRIQDVSVGIMGLGTLGLAAAEVLEKCGFSCAGWTRTSRPNVNFQVYTGQEELIPFLRQSQILVCLLPLTPETRYILNYNNFLNLPEKSYLINVARGPLLVESDLLKALASGILSGATLDVFSQEPLPKEHPFWKHPQISITPHVASISDPSTVVPQIVKNYRALLDGNPLINQVILNRGY